ncbi:MAG: serine/threonine protein kinase [Lachnospiraceae bacterium]|nr:serine/threonine protein kinase [Lachnospiraceae bacterium]
MRLRKGGMTAKAGKYRIISQICTHSDSTVWLAEHTGLHVKRIIKGIKKTSSYHDRLIKEAHLLKNLKHPFIPEIYDLDEDDDHTYIIEQYITGKSLRSLCETRLLSEKEIFHFIIQISNIINYLHSLPDQIIYLDIKPDNIIISDNDCFLIDFGSVYPNDLSDTKVFGTRAYASPEQLTGGRLTKSSDLYSLGKLLEYMLLHGNVSPKTEKALRKIIDRCTEKTIWHRINSIEGLLARINEIKKNTSSFSIKPIRVSFAGAAGNTGTTYLSLLFSGYLNSLGRKCTYAEANDSGAWYSLAGMIKNNRALAGLETLSRKSYENSTETSNDSVVDHGCLIKDMPEDFFRSDIVCITLGNQSWEIDEAVKAKALSRRCRRRIFLVTPAQKISSLTAEALDGEKYLAVPYIADPDEILKNTEVKTVLHELAVYAGIITE